MCNLGEITIALSDVRQIAPPLERRDALGEGTTVNWSMRSNGKQRILNATVSISRNESVVNTDREDYRALSGRNHDVAPHATQF